MHDNADYVKRRWRCRLGLHHWINRKTKYLPRTSYWQECWDCKRVRNAR